MIRIPAPIASRLRATSPLPPEDSLLLRLLAQGLVSIGILATDLVVETHMGWWAVPLSFLGAAWSWRQRRSANIAVKFLLAIGMLLALVAFFSNLVAGQQMNDTRLALVSLLIQVQVLHSFDLPRRKDLGYSMIIGLILMSVASTLSQTMAFGGMLLAFVCLAVPVLMMDYRSRLGLSKWSAGRGGRIDWAGLPVILGLVLVLGLGLFAVMPRFPGYQLRAFPMSAPIALQGKFNNQQVRNPGYVGGGKPGSGKGSSPAQGKSPSEGAGQMDDTIYSGFNTKMNQNLRGQMKPLPVLRVRSQSAGFWRVLAFDRYTGQGWELGRNDQTKTIKRPDFTYQFYIPRPVTLSKSKDIVQTYTLLTDLPNLIPSMSLPKEVFFPTEELAIDSELGLRSPADLSEGLTYTVISEVPLRDRAKLQKTKASLPSDPSGVYTQMPEPLRAKVRAKAEALLAQSTTPITSDYEKALYLAQALKQRYKVRYDLPYLKQGEDMVEAFLFKFEGGYPDHFSTVLTVMLRSLGLSARLSAGFGPGQFNPFTGLYTVQNVDAFTVTEVFFYKYGWFAFDPIPGHPLLPPSVEENQTFAVLKQFWNWVAGWLPSPVAGFLNSSFGWLMGALAGALGWFVGLFAQGWWGWLVGLLVATVGAFLLWILGKALWRLRLWRRWSRLEPIDRLYQQMTYQLSKQGFVPSRSQTPLEYARQVSQGVSAEVGAIVGAIAQTYVAWRYGGEQADVGPLRARWRSLKPQPIKFYRRRIK
jgi:protein-glutamine gamma-glutamyltransferase